MTDLPYTDDDLRAEAARQHYTATTDPDFMGIGEQMDSSPIESTFYNAAGERHEQGRVWDQLDGDDFDAAQRAIDDLLGKAADVSEWAINLGADGLEPVGANLNIKDSGGEDRVRLHFAFAPDMDKATRKAVMDRVADVIRHHS